jgi:hypothetical protein
MSAQLKEAWPEDCWCGLSGQTGCAASVAPPSQILPVIE